MDLLQAVEPQQQTSHILTDEQVREPMITSPVQRSLANIEEQMATIRNELDKKSPKVTTVQIGQKLDRIINILRKNGISE